VEGVTGACQICAFEMRKNVTKDVSFCKSHGVRCCTIVRPLEENSKITAAVEKAKKDGDINGLLRWYCKNTNATGWQKAHMWYIPRGLFGKKPTYRTDKFGCPKAPCLAVSSEIYQQRSKWQFEEGIISELPKRGFKKRKANVVEGVVAEVIEEEEFQTPDKVPDTIPTPRRISPRRLAMNSTSRRKSQRGTSIKLDEMVPL